MGQYLLQRIGYWLTGWIWLVWAVLTTGYITFGASTLLDLPPQVDVLVWGLCRLCWGAYLGLLIAHSLVGRRRRGESRLSANVNGCEDPAQRCQMQGLNLLSRAVVVGCAMLAMGAQV